MVELPSEVIVLIRRRFVAMVASAGLASCGQDAAAPRTVEPTPVVPTPQVLSVAVQPASAIMPIGGTLQLSAVVAADPGAATTVSWTSSDTLRIKVTQDGVVSARQASGWIDVCATSKVTPTKLACARVIVSVATDWEAVSVVPTSANLAVGDTVRLYAALAHEPVGSTSFRWTSADSGRVVVDSTGRATARAATTGTAVCARPATHPDWVGCSNVVVRSSR